MSKILTAEQYQRLASESGLNRLLRELFSPIESIEQCRSLYDKAEKVRQALLKMQTMLYEQLKHDNILKTLPLRFMRDYQTRSGMFYLRWRNPILNKAGQEVFKDMLVNLQNDHFIREKLLQMEKARLVLNMQVHIILNILSQLDKTNKEMAQVIFE